MTTIAATDLSALARVLERRLQKMAKRAWSKTWTDLDFVVIAVRYGKSGLRFTAIGRDPQKKKKVTREYASVTVNELTDEDTSKTLINGVWGGLNAGLKKAFHFQEQP